MGCFAIVSLGSLLVALSLGDPEHKIVARSVCPAGTFSHQDGSQWYCYKFVDERVTYQEAEEECQFKWNGHLASFTSDTQAKYVGAYVSKENLENDYVWIGLQRTPASNMKTGWRWTDGSRSKYTHWNPSEPNNLTKNEFCVVLWPQAGLKWIDIDCNNKFPFLCKWKRF